MEIPTRKQFIKHIKDHLDETGEKPSSFGRRVLNDSGAIPRLYEGTDPRLSTMRKIVCGIKGIEDKDDEDDTRT
jgi:predicted transcriptional regulator